MVCRSNEKSVRLFTFHGDLNLVDSSYCKEIAKKRASGSANRNITQKKIVSMKI